MRYTIFGESHGPAIGVTLEGVPGGLTLDQAQIRAELDRRATGKNALSTARKEDDAVHFLSGVFEGKTTGDPICAVIQNSGQHSGDYATLRELARPGHADYTGFLASNGCNDYRGGGHFSGRLTAPLVVAGAIARQLLALREIRVAAHIYSIAGILDASADMACPDMDALEAAGKKPFPTLDDGQGTAMQAAILRAREERDSVGGTVECVITGVPAGLGRPDFGCNVEGLFAQYYYAVPAVKAVAFGDGFAFADLRGSEANDAFCLQNGEIRTRTNHNGGVNGGITNGMPIVTRVAIKPTPSIAKEQQTVNFRQKTETVVEIHGRHDPCIVHRAVPVIEAAAALAACELIERSGSGWKI